MSRPHALPTAAQPRKRSMTTIVKIAAAVVLLFFISRWISGSEQLPDFGRIENTSEKKEAFFSYLLPYITAVNDEILQQRTRLQSIRRDLAEDDDEPGWFDRRRLRELCEAYDLEPPEAYDLALVDRLLRRVDIIAPSLIMAQAANESAWGTSRFAREGNNLFGMRTYEPGTGIVPKRRPAGATWEVAAYDSVRGGIEALAHNLNTNASYRQMRSIRRDLRRRDAPITGSALAGGLVRYSEKGYEYISLVRSMIRSNNLERYDRPTTD